MQTGFNSERQHIDQVCCMCCILYECERSKRCLWLTRFPQETCALAQANELKNAIESLVEGEEEAMLDQLTEDQLTDDMQIRDEEVEWQSNDDDLDTSEPEMPELTLIAKMRYSRWNRSFIGQRAPPL